MKKNLPMKNLFLGMLIIGSLMPSETKGQSSATWFGRYGLFSSGFGVDRDWEGADRHDYWERAVFWDQRIGVSLTRRVYSGLLVQWIRAGNFEQSVQSYYTAGLWGRYYLVQPITPEKRRRWGVYVESGVQTGNFDFENRNFIEYYRSTPGKFFVQGRISVEYRLWRAFYLEAATQFLLPAKGSWDANGTGYLSAGFSWRPGPL